MFIFEWSATMGMSDKKYKLSNKDDLYKFDLAFDGELVENSADAFDVANTIIALSSALHQIIELEFGEDIAKQANLNINAFREGSLKTQFLLMFTDPSQAKENVELLAVGAWGAYQVGKKAVGVFKDYVDVKKWLKGKKPDRIEANAGGDKYNIHLKNSSLNINKTTLKALQDKTVAKNIDKAIEPLEKEGSELEALTITTQDDKKPSITISQAEAKYIKTGDEELQTIDKMRLKGVVTKIDTKVRSGYLNLGNMGARRVAFSYRKDLEQLQFDILVRSLRSKVQIYLIGAVESDMEGLPKSIDIIGVEEDEKLL